LGDEGDIQHMKLTSTICFLGIIALSIFYAGCNKCPAEAKETYTYELSDTAKSTVPYAVNDSFQMADTAGNEVTFAVMSRDRVLEPQDPCECCPSETNEHMEMNLNRNASAQAVRFFLVQDGKDDVMGETHWTCWVDSSAFSMKVVGDSLIAQSPSSATVHNSMLVGSHTFLDVYEINNGATDSARVNTIWYNTQNGLLKFKLVNGQVWSLL
jgi:hypothetical protein